MLIYLLADYCLEGIHPIDPHSVKSRAPERVPVQHVELSLHGGIPLVLLPVRLELKAGRGVGVPLHVPTPEEVHAIGCALPCHYASCFDLSHSVSFSFFF